MTEPIFVTYWTDKYKQHAREWLLSAHELGLRCSIAHLECAGSWQANCQKKPAFLLEMLQQFPAGPVVWVDVDARFRSRPDLLMDWQDAPNVAYHTYRLTGGRAEPMSGTIWLDNRTGSAARWLKAWAALCHAQPDVYDQVLMGRTEVECCSIDRDLPAEYCFIFDVFRKPFYKHNHPDVAEPIIEHLQASRTLSDKVKAK